MTWSGGSPASAAYRSGKQPTRTPDRARCVQTAETSSSSATRKEEPQPQAATTLGSDLKAGALEALGVVDDRPADVGQARAVHQQAQPVVLEDLVAGALGVEGQRVLKARAAAAPHTHAQAGGGRVGVLGVEKLLDLLGASVGEGDHGNLTLLFGQLRAMLHEV